MIESISIADNFQLLIKYLLLKCCCDKMTEVEEQLRIIGIFRACSFCVVIFISFIKERKSGGICYE